MLTNNSNNDSCKHIFLLLFRRIYMSLKTFKKALLLGAIIGGIGQVNASTLHGLSGTQTISNYIAYIDGNATDTVAGLTFTPATTAATADYTEPTPTNATTLTTPTFSDGMTLRVSGAGALILTGASFTQLTTPLPYITFDVASALMTFSTAPTFTGDGWIEVNQNTTLTCSAAMALTAPIKIATGKVLTLAGGANAITLAGIVSGAGGLTYTSSAGGSLTIGTSPTFTGAFTHSSTATTPLILSNGVTFSPNVTLSVANNLIYVPTNAEATVSGVVSGAFALTVNNASNTGNLTLSGSNTFGTGIAANVNLASGTLTVGNSSALSNVASAGLTLTGNATVALGTTGLTVSNPIATGSNALTICAGAGISGTLSGAITGAGVATKTGAGTVALSNASNAPASWTLSGGTVNLSSTGVLGANVTVAGATALGYLSTLTDSHTFLLNEPLTLNVASGMTATLTGVVSGSSSLTMTGANGILKLNGANTYAGGTNITSGQIVMGCATALGSSPIVTINPGASLTQDGSAHTYSPTTATTTINIS